MKANSIYSNLLQFDSLSAYRDLFHFSTTVNGGCSVGKYATFNLGLYSGDNHNDVTRNRCRLSDMLEVEFESLYFPYQTHGTDILMIDEAFLIKDSVCQLELMKGVDAVITNQKNICIGVSTADCVPILIYDPKRNILAAIHAGWRGTVARISEKVVTMMKGRFGCEPQDLKVGIGPSISCGCFEVGEEVVSEFECAGFVMEQISNRNSLTGKIHIDLWKANRYVLIGLGVSGVNIEIAGLCTYSNPDLFFSARRQSIQSGRMITGGVLR